MDSANNSNGREPEPDSKHRIIRIFYIVSGIISLIIGLIGIFLPILPTTPFLLLSAACFYRGSEKLHDWLLNSSIFGPSIKSYEEKGGLTKTTKVKAILITWITVILTTYYLLDSPVNYVGLIVLALIGSTVIWRIKTVD